jgi:hypothetical protein
VPILEWSKYPVCQCTTPDRNDSGYYWVVQWYSDNGCINQVNTNFNGRQEQCAPVGQLPSPVNLRLILFPTGCVRIPKLMCIMVLEYARIPAGNMIRPAFFRELAAQPHRRTVPVAANL